MSDTPEYSTLRWIKGELDETLRQARRALEDYVDGGCDAAVMRPCVDKLHQIHGTLHMVQLYGPAMLAEEMELLAKALGDEGVRQKNESAEALMRAMIQLPDYLDKLLAGYRDIPLIILPLMNDLRAARDANLLSDVALLSTELDRKLAKGGEGQTPNEALPQIARRHRHHYHLGQLSWYRGSNVKGGLDDMRRVISMLETNAGTEPMRQLFRVAGAVAIGLREEAIESGIAVKLLLGRVDRQIKRIIDQGEGEAAREPALDLLKNLLYYVAQAETDNEVIQGVKDTFELDQILPRKLEVEAGRQRLSAPNRELLETVRDAIREDIVQIKDGLDLFIRGGALKTEGLFGLEGPMRKIADTLGMVGQGALRERMKGQADRIAEIGRTGEVPDEPELMEMAGDILFVEVSLNNLVAGQGASKEDAEVKAALADAREAGVVHLAEGEFDQLVSTVMREAAVDMAKIKEAIISFVESPRDTQLFEGVSAHFHAVCGALKMMNFTEASTLLEALARFIHSRVVEGRDTLETEQVNALADAVTSIEYYMEAVAEAYGDREGILDVARQAVDLLELEEEAKTEPPGEFETDKEVDLSQAAEVSLQEEPDTCEEAFPLSVSLPSAEKPSLDEDDIDPEIVAIFVEEAREELDVIREYLAQWCRNPDDQEALTTFRRSFHTLKGSGRLVGAKAIGELAWSVENLLNRVIDQTIPYSQDILDLLDDTLAALPGMVDRHEAGRPSDMEEIEPLTERAFRLASPGVAESDSGLMVSSAMGSDSEPISDSGFTEQLSVEGEEEEGAEESMEIEAVAFDEGAEEEAGEREDEPVETDEIPAGEVAIRIDSALYEIFNTECRGHLAMLNEFFQSCREDPGACHLGEEISRAFHTLHGSAHMAEVVPIAEVSAALERLSEALMAAGQRPDEEQNSLFAQGIQTVETVLDMINTAGGEIPDWQPLVEDITRHLPVLKEIEERNSALAEEAEALSAEAAPEQAGEEAESVLSEDFEEEPGIPESDSVLEIEIESEEISPAPEEGEEYEGSTAEEPEEASSLEVQSLPESEEPESILSEDSGWEPGVAEPESVPESEIEEAPATPEEAAEIQQESEDGGVALERALTTFAEGGGADSQMIEVVDREEQTTDTAADAVVDEELTEIFLEEARELLDALDNALREWRADPAVQEPLVDLQRTLHTLKGGARLAGLMAIGDLSHAFESLLTAVDHGRLAPSEALFALAHTVADRLVGQVESVGAGGKAEPADDLLSQLESLLRPEPADEQETLESGKETAEEEPPSPHPEMEELEEESREVEIPLAETPLSRLEEEDKKEEEKPSVLKSTTEREVIPRPALRPRQEQVRVRSELLDRLVNHAGEVSIYRARLEQQNGALGFNLSELEQTVNRLRDQLRNLEIETEAQILFRYEREKEEEGDASEVFDPLELDRFSTMQQLSRSLIETVNDLISIKGLLEDLTRENETLLLQQSRVTTDLQDGLLRTRMVPFSQLVPRLHRVVRQTCMPLGKQAELEVYGAEGEMDRGILDRMIAPLEHILRNAVSHGIETPDIRRGAAKGEKGEISLYLTREGTDVVITVADDGAGLKLKAIRRRAEERGLLAPEAEITDADLMQFILEPGFSTEDEITQIAGRGVGMDVVVSEVKQLGGSLELESRPGQGSRFAIRLPLTLAISDALLVQLGDETYAIPHTSIEGVVRVSRSELQDCYDERQEGFSYAGRNYKVRYLGTMLGTAQAHISEQIKWYPLLLVRSGEHRVALQVDGLMGNRQIVVKSVGPQLSTVRWITGGTILGDGTVALILDVSALVRIAFVQAVAPPVEEEVEESSAAAGATVMVVDDSITVRKVTSRLLERHNMEVLTAKDGVDAVALLQDHKPDVMLLDIEMPRMDGFELARHMRSIEEWRDIPIIMITSRTGEKHRKLAMELGVKRYLGKPYQEADLLENIYSLLAEKTS